MSSLLAELADLVLPRRCAACGEPGPALCAECAGGLTPFALDLDGLVGVSVVAVGAYEGALRSAVLAYKEHGRRDVGVILARLLARSIEGAVALADELPRGGIALVPVPSSKAAARVRGGQHVLRMARLGSRAGTGYPIAPHALWLRRATRDSAGLTVDERQANLAGAMAAARPPPDLAAIIVDDVVTTGATVIEAARALSQVGWPVAGVAVIAATTRRFPAAAPR